jgi:hypothetical protein
VPAQAPAANPPPPPPEAAAADGSSADKSGAPHCTACGARLRRWLRMGLIGRASSCLLPVVL